MHDGLRLILSAHGQLADNAQVLEFLQFAVARKIVLSDLWLAEADGRIIWAVLPIVSPGRTMLLLGPSHYPVAAGNNAPARLADAVCTHFSGRGVKLAQSLIEPADADARNLLQGVQFHPMAELEYLQANVRRSFPTPRLEAQLSWIRYTRETHPLFAGTIARTYQNSLDCPGLNGLRDMEDIIAGHKSSGEFDPSLWFLLTDSAANKEPLGVLLLSVMPRHEAMELVYVGLIPEARGRALGSLLIRQALAVTAASNLPKLSLAVDAGNSPALKLYHRHGFQHVGRKLAMMRILEAQKSGNNDAPAVRAAET